MTSKAGIAVLAAVVVVAAAVVSVVVVAGDGGGQRDTTSAPPPTTEASGPVVIESAAGPPGTSLGDGFTLVEGTTLIGDPIPIGVEVVQSGTPIVDEGWTASSVVDGGDPLAILDAYLRQAEATGLVRESGPGCVLDQEVTICSVFARTPEPASPRSFTAQVVRGMRDDVLSDHVVLRFSTTDLHWQYGLMAAGGDGPSVSAAPTTWPPLPVPGEGMGTAGELGYDLPVQEGSRLAGPPHLDLEDATGGIVALLEVTAEPRTVLDAYLDRLADVNADVSDPEMREIGDAAVTTAFAGWAGGDAFALTLVEREGRPTWLAISASHD
ncbi:hypothetical protein HC251_09785 [Iamia sp. SCSIO 61187]|uniref:hypothetical protein n=1 Tax=Iamia sp. SCSIO 61187 TaxID=2722752 RepID=UPI001C6296A3|nr:hypothetical protein [Iamia sp. SCSIO 61187]QYG92693.1 hypothetical protein HC251_09785 [Iamia sp. SCSIO 61187]